MEIDQKRGNKMYTEASVSFPFKGAGVKGTEKKIQQVETGDPLEHTEPLAVHGGAVYGFFFHVPALY